MSAEPRVLSGRYRIDEVIGVGGMARVYRGYDLTLERAVAIKILEGPFSSEPAFRARFRLEAQAASRMSHPSIVRVFDAGDPASGTAHDPSEPPYIVMELVEGMLLKDIMTQGPVPVEDAVGYVDGILEALEYSHRAGVIHRDIKPGNVMVTDTGQVKVMDFGIARAVTDSSATVVETTRLLGTAAYLSPEQAKGDPIDERTDLYSAGIVLYELLTGQQPFRGDSPVAVAYQHVSEAPPLPSDTMPSVPRMLNAIVLRALAKHPDQRFADATSFRAALAASLVGREPSRRKVGALADELYGVDMQRNEQTVRSFRQMSTDTSMTRTQSGPPVVWIWAGVVLVAILVASVVFWVANVRPTETLPSNSRTIPPLAGMTFTQAQAALRDLDLFAREVREPSDTVEEGLVTRTDPAEGYSVPRGFEVVVYISSGVVTSTVPELIGLTDAAARTALEEAGLERGAITRRNDANAAAGTVLDASHRAGDQVRPGTIVNLVVASGRITLGDLSGWPLTDAITRLEELRLQPLPVENPDCPETTPHTVWTMSVAPGDVPIHSEVELSYCTGK